MKVADKIRAFAKLGEELQELAGNPDESFLALCRSAFHQNGWFTGDNVRHAFESIGRSLQESKLDKWLSAYGTLPWPPASGEGQKRVAVIMAGNVPAVGFHDFLCVLMSGHHFIGKLSADDRLLLPFIAERLAAIEPAFRDKIAFTEKQLPAIDAVIATGSNNTSRYFEYYFSGYPHIIRKNRNSAAILDGAETAAELEQLGEDIFRYFGLGCRNVSKLFVPEHYPFTEFFQAVYPYKTVLQNNKYANNYEYNRTIYLMSKTPLLDNNFLLLKEDIGMASPVGVLYYEYYRSSAHLKERLRQDKSSIQCLVSGHMKEAVPFGKAQYPELWDYADKVDTMKFLLSL